MTLVDRWLRRRVPPPETRALRDVLERHRTGASSIGAVGEALRKATLFTAAPPRGGVAGHAVPGLVAVTVPLLGFDPAARTWCLFTAPTAARAALGRRCRPHPVPALDALRSAAGGGLTLHIDPTLDPGGAPTGTRMTLEPGQSGKLAAGLVPDGRGGWRVLGRLRCAIEGPARPCPDGLCAALGLIARREPGVESAHLVELPLAAGDRPVGMALTTGAAVRPADRASLLLRVEGHLATLFRGHPAPTVFLATADQRDAVFDRGLPLFVRDGLGGTGIEVPDGHRVGLVLPSARPAMLSTDTGTLLVDFGPDLERFEETLSAARQRLSARPGPVVWVLQRTAIDRLDPERESVLRAVFESIEAAGLPAVSQRAVVSAETSTGRALAERIGAVGLPVHALGSTREVAVEVTGPEVGRLGLPGRFLAGPDPRAE